MFQSVSCKCITLLLQSCPKDIFSVSLRMHGKSAQRRHAKHKKTSRGIFSQRNPVALCNENNMKANERLSGFRKSLAIFKSHYSFQHYFYCLDIKQFFLVRVSVYNDKKMIGKSFTRLELQKYSVDQNPTN